MRQLFAVFSLGTAVLTPLAAQEAAGFDRLGDVLVTMVREDSVVGAAAALVRDGRIVTHREVGFADRGARRRLGPNAIFHWGSITKTLTAVAILQLRDRGRLSLDDPITKWVPELRQVHDPFGSMDAITLGMLLSHSSGFQNPTWPYRRYVAWEPFEPTRWEQLVAMMPYQEILFRPGSRFGYSNPAYIYLARVIDAITGDPYQSYIYKNLWGPLGLNRSYFGVTPYHLVADRSHNYSVTRDSLGSVHLLDNGPDFDPGITIPNGGWNAPMSDVAVWVSALAGPAGSSSVLARETLAAMWRPVVPIGNVGAWQESMGLGFFVLERDGKVLIGHTGEQAGFRSFVFFNPRTRIGVLVCLNTVNEAESERDGRLWQQAVEAGLQAIGN